MTAFSISLGIGSRLYVASGDIAIVTDLLPTVPDAFAASDWTLADPATGGALTVTIVTRPGDGGSAITALQYQIGSDAWTAIGPLDGQGHATIPGLQDGTACEIRLRAVNAVGAGEASAAKSATPSAPVVAPTISVTQQPALPVITAGQRPSDLTIPLGAATRSPAGASQPAPARELKRGGTDFATASDWLTAQSVAGEKVFVRTKWTLEGAADIYSDVIQATVQAAVVAPAIDVPGTWALSAVSGDNRTATFTHTTFTGSAPMTYDRSWRIDGMAGQVPTASTTTTASFTFPATQTPLLEAREQATNTAGIVGPLFTSIQVAAPAQPLTLTQNAQGTAEGDVALGTVTYSLTAPAIYAGTYSTTTALLEGGPVFFVPPAITGNTTGGSVLTAIPGLVLHPADKPVTITRQWLRDGAEIAGATGETYTLVSDDRGAGLALRETATNADGGRSSTSAALAIPVPAPTQAPVVVNFGDGSRVFAGTTLSAGKQNAPATQIRNADGSPSWLNVQLTHPGTGFVYNGESRSTGVAAFDGTLYNDVIYGLSLSGANGLLTVILSGCVANADYDISAGGSRAATGSRITTVTDGVVSMSYNACENPAPQPVTARFRASASGVITLTVGNGPTGTSGLAYIAGMKVVPV